MEKDLPQILPNECAGKLMTVKVPIAKPDDTIKTVEEYLLKNIKNLTSINYVYIVSDSGELKGVISIKEIFRQTKNKVLSKVMTKNPVYAHSHTHQETLATIALKNNIKAVPIVDKDEKFLGAVLSDTILEVVYKEFQKDISHFAGVKYSSHIDDINSMSLSLSLRHRLPWLFVGLLGGLFTARVIGLFENTLAQNIILASFIPLVVYISSAVGTQVSFFIIRDLAINPKINFLSYLFRQSKVVIAIGLIISLLSFGITSLLYGQSNITLVLACAIFLSIASSIITGLFIPYILSKFRCDPANASGPIATIVQDLMSVIIYLLVATMFL